jgi:hypothetical protein
LKKAPTVFASVLSQTNRTTPALPLAGVHRVATLRGIAVTTGTDDSSDQLARLARSYLRSNKVTGNVNQLEKVALHDVFRLLDRISKKIDRMELRRLYDLLTELAVVRENTILAHKASHEARLIKAIQHTGRLGKFLSSVLDEAT